MGHFASARGFQPRGYVGRARPALDSRQNPVTMCEIHKYEIILLSRSGETIPAIVGVSVWDRDEDGRRRRDCKLRISWTGGNGESSEFSVYHALTPAREQLKLIPQCYGACPNVHVSSMAVDLSDGTSAYRLNDPRDG